MNEQSLELLVFGVQLEGGEPVVAFFVSWLGEDQCSAFRYVPSIYI